MSLNGFEHKLLKFIRDEYRSFEGALITVGLSGGADSVALLKALCELRPLLSCRLEAFHVHHGSFDEDVSSVQNKFRDDALDFSSKFSESLKVSFKYVKSKKPLRKEEECREFRQNIFKDFDHVFLAHHSDDYLETVLLRLIRGTGAQGFIDPFSSSEFFRPFLNLFGKEEILRYLEEKGVGFIEDPSNFEDDYLRNWVRNKWLKDLKKQSGISGLSKSLNLISQALKESLKPEKEAVLFEDDKFLSGTVDLSLWLSFNQFQKQSTVAHILLKTLKKGYTKGQVDEIVKGLGLKQKEVEFDLCSLRWTKDLKKITFLKV